MNLFLWRVSLSYRGGMCSLLCDMRTLTQSIHRHLLNKPLEDGEGEVMLCVWYGFLLQI